MFITSNRSSLPFMAHSQTADRIGKIRDLLGRAIGEIKN